MNKEQDTLREETLKGLAVCAFDGDGFEDKDGLAKLIDFFRKERSTARLFAFQEVLDEMERRKGQEKGYDGNNLGSACDFYGIAADSWAEIIRYEGGINATLSDLKSYITSLMK